MTNKTNILLSIDGGGVKSVIPITILNEIEKLVGHPISENIDYFTGTSAGALIVANLALKDEAGRPLHTSQEILNMINSNSKNIFSEKGWGLFDAKYSRSGLDNLLEKTFKNIKLSEIKSTSITAFNLNDYSPKVWSTLKALKNSKS